ncbi:uncharacterized protein isoform X2 [Leptinotarsa decemlineata]|uniref:uncharacterized protein isoform X2 n=1 Tax=Leptinotarsa decemlineata TaxID=7539 RepID=UPI003D3057B4
MSRGRSETSTKVFVGSLPNGASPEDLRKLFEPYGEISECDIANRCGFLHLEDEALAMKAIEELNGTDFMGTKISVERGRVKPRRSGGGGGPRGGRDRGSPYSRGGGDFRGPPRNGGFGGGRDFPPHRGGGYDRPQRGGFGGGGFDERRGGPSYDDRRMGGAGEYDRRSGGPGGYDDRRGGPDRRLYDDRQGFDSGRGGFDDRRPIGGYDDRRSGTERRPMLDAQGDRGVPSGSFDRSGSGDLFSRRDQGALSKATYDNRAGGYGPSSNGYGEEWEEDMQMSRLLVMEEVMGLHLLVDMVPHLLEVMALHLVVDMVLLLMVGMVPLLADTVPLVVDMDPLVADTEIEVVMAEALQDILIPINLEEVQERLHLEVDMTQPTLLFLNNETIQAVADLAECEETCLPDADSEKKNHICALICKVASHFYLKHLRQ